MNFIDLFSGIGGFRSALEKNGHKCIAYSEIDKYAKQSYQAMYDTKDEIDLGDITKISEDYLSHFKEKNDIVVGGSPCQSFSLAGARKGFEDTRGTLFFEYAKVVKETQPKYFLFENVKGMLSHDKGNTIRVVLETFNQLGYYIDFNIFNSKYYDVPQNRERIYIVGKRKDTVDNPEHQEKVEGKKKFDEVHNWAVDNINYVKLLPELQTEVTVRLVDVLEDEVDEKFYLPKEKVGKLVMNINSNKAIGVREATKQGYAIAEQGDSVNVSYPTSKTRRGRVGKQVAQTLQAGEVNQGVVINPLKDKTEYGWHFEQAVYDSQGITRTVKANGGSGNIPKTIEGLRIRKLTPLECWRLQSFTDEQFYKAKDSGVSNSQLYKQAGNAVTVNVVDAIVKELD